jgi:hypothetical protein
MTRLFELAAGMGLPYSRYARLEQAHTGDLQTRRYTNLPGRPVQGRPPPLSPYGQGDGMVD